MLNKLGHFFFNRFRDNEAKLHELNYLFWECTWRCNLACIHCGSDCVSDARIEDMPFQDFLNAIIPLKEKFKRDSITVVITGGEPLLRSDLAQCGRVLRQHGFRWGIVTNGLAYSKNKHAQLMASGMGSVTVSIDGLEQQHNALRENQMSFKKAVEALDLIVQSKRLFYDVVTCVHPGNIDHLHDLKQFLISKKVKAWRLFTIAPIGRAAKNPQLQLNGWQFKQLMDFICMERKHKQIDIKFSCEAYVGDYERKVRDSYFFCRAGINIGSILIDGSISACPNIDRQFVQGNIYRQRFIDVWEDEFKVMRNRDWTKTGICATCSQYNHCKGGAMHLWTYKKDNISLCIYHEMSQTVQ